MKSLFVSESLCLSLSFSASLSRVHTHMNTHTYAHTHMHTARVFCGISPHVCIQKYKENILTLQIRVIIGREHNTAIVILLLGSFCYHEFYFDLFFSSKIWQLRFQRWRYYLKTQQYTMSSSISYSYSQQLIYYFGNTNVKSTWSYVTSFIQ